MPTTINKIIESRHAAYLENVPIWQYFADHAAGGPMYASKINPLARTVSGWTGVSSTSQKAGMGRYVVQHGLEDVADYLNRLYKAPAVNLCGPAIDMLAGTVGSQGTVSMSIPDAFQDLIDDADLTGSSFSQFMTACRAHAATFGLTFILVDSTRAAGEIKTQLDVEVQGIRPFYREVLPADLLNWRLDPNGKPIEILFRVPVEAPGSIQDEPDSTSSQRYEYRYWDRSRWIVYRQTGESSYEIADQAEHSLQEVPLVTLYHKKIAPFQGQSLLKESAKYSQMLANWLSDLDQTTTQQSFSQACLRSNDTPTQVGYGSTRVLHIKPGHKGDAGDSLGEEDFFFRSPDPGPLATMWDSFYRMIDMANSSMSLSPDAETDKSHPESGVSRAWRWHALEKRLTQMVEHEQSAVNVMFELAAHWMGQTEFPGSITYGSHFDLTSLDTDIQAMLSLQKIGLPPSAQLEMKSRLVKKALPNTAPDQQTQIDSELKTMHQQVDTRALRDAMDQVG